MTKVSSTHLLTKQEWKDPNAHGARGNTSSESCRFNNRFAFIMAEYLQLFYFFEHTFYFLKILISFLLPCSPFSPKSDCLVFPSSASLETWRPRATWLGRDGLKGSVPLSWLLPLVHLESIRDVDLSGHTGTFVNGNNIIYMLFLLHLKGFSIPYNFWKCPTVFYCFPP